MEPERSLMHVSFSVDANCVNARQGIPAMNRLEAWAADEIIELITSETAQREMFAGNSPNRTKKAYTYIYSKSEITTPQEHARVKQIEQILCPNPALLSKHQNDIDIVFNAGKYMRPLITNDGESKKQPNGILGNKVPLEAIGIKIVTPEEAVAQVEAAIQQRDSHARQWAEYYKKELPEWVGKD